MGHKEEVRSLPQSPGVYIMKDEKGRILYVGKACNVRKRVASYFYPNKKHPERLAIMVSKVSRIDCIPTSTEAEALVYENSLIKQLSPKYNVALRDDKSYPRLKLTMGEKFPRLLITRKKTNDGSLYFGPYTSAKLLRDAVFAMRQLFPLRTCVKMPRGKCLNYDINQCPGPCIGKVNEETYAQMVQELRTFLEKGKSELIKQLTDKMTKASRNQDYEQAAQIRTRIEALGTMRGSSVRYAPGDELEEFKQMSGLKGRVESIEAFDVSNISGQEAVGSMVYFYKGRPRKSQYRKFKIRSVLGVDDYSMMREIVHRRYSRILDEGKKLPDLVLIDGGKGHLGAACEELARLGITDLPIIGIAKEFEHIYLPGRASPIILPRDSKALHLLERIRDEAHRFAIKYHKSLRSKKISLSELDGIRGIGKKRKKALLERFGSVERIRDASLDDLISVEGISEKAARHIKEHFKE